MPSNLITKSDIKFWLAIIGVVVSGIVAFTSLQKDVEAMIEREQVNKEGFVEVCSIVRDIQKKVIEIDKNQAIIMRELGINE